MANVKQNMLRSNAQVFDYLSPGAKTRVLNLTDMGVQPDLAIAIVEKELPEEDLYKYGEEE